MARLIRTDWPDFGTPDVPPAFSLTDALLIASNECLLCTGCRLVGADEVDDPATAQDIPAFLADPLHDNAGRVENATDLTMHSGNGLRARVDVAEVVRLEFANHKAASGLRVARRHDGFRSGAGGRDWRFALGLPCDLCGG